MKISFSLKNFTKKEVLNENWDVIIIGGGPAGYSAALYCGRYKLRTLVITKYIGGLLNEASIVEDYPGIKRISGPELGRLFKDHAEEWGVKTLIDEALDVRKDMDLFTISTRNGYTFKSRVIIFATGSKRRTLGVPGENLNGISYCAECDAPLYSGKVVAVVGGGNTAFHDALVLSKYAKKVYLVHRRKKFKADPVLVDEAKLNSNIEFVLNKIVLEIKGQSTVEKIVLKDRDTEDIIELDVQGVFVAVGLEPSTELAKKLGVELDDDNRIKVDPCMKTNIEGVFAAGDVTSGSCRFMQIVTSAAEGAIAAYNAFRYILRKM